MWLFSGLDSSPVLENEGSKVNPSSGCWYEEGLASGPVCYLSPPSREEGRGRPTSAVTTCNASCACSSALGERVAGSDSGHSEYLYLARHHYFHVEF